MSNSYFDWPVSVTRFVKFDGARADDVNNALDEVTAGFDGVETKTNAALKLPDGETATTFGNAAARKGKLVSFNATTGAVEATISTVDVATVAGIASDVTTVSGIAGSVTAVASVDNEVVTVAGNAANVATVAGISGDVTTVAGNSANVTTVATDIANVNTVAGNSANINTVAGVSGNVTTVAGIAADVTTVAAVDAEVSVVTGISADVSAVAGVSADVSAVAAQFIGWNFSTTTTMADPGSGVMRFNNATVASVTAIAVDDLNSAAADVSAYVMTWDDASSTIKGTLTIRQGTANFAIFNVTGLTDNAGWAEIAVTHVSSSGTFANGVLTFVDFDRTGDAGVGDFKADGTVPMTGDLQIGAGKGIIFEGTTADDYETTLVAGEPTADRVVTLPNATTTLAGLAVAQSFTEEQTFKEVKDTVYTITDGAAFEIDPANGSIQTVTLSASRTPAATNFEAGQCVLLGIDDGTAYSITWTNVVDVWVKAGGTASAPTLATSGYTWVLLWKVGSVKYATEVGKP